MFQKYAKLEVLEVKSAPSKERSASLSKFAEYDDYRTEDGYVYVRVRAISSRVNKNHDGWPATELEKSWRTFIGKPIFVDHHNSDPKRARGVIVDAALHIEDEKTASLDPYYSAAPANHLPATWIELLLEVDAKKFPKLAKAIVDGDIDGVSMGANVELSKCSHCGNEARSPEQYCKHVQSKGAYFDFHTPSGQKVAKKSYEDCYDIGFFEISFVFDPADETALVRDIKKAARVSAVQVEGAQQFRVGEEVQIGGGPGSGQSGKIVDYTANGGILQYHVQTPYGVQVAQQEDLVPVYNIAGVAPGVGAQGAIPPAEGLDYYTPDEVAETLSGISTGTYQKLWELVDHLDRNKQAVPMGGDRHDPYGEHGTPTVETPGDRNDFLGEGSTGSVVSVWNMLSPEQQTEINAAMKAADAEWDAAGQQIGLEDRSTAKTANMNDDVVAAHRQGQSLEAIARSYGMNANEIRQILRGRGVTADRNPEPQSDMTVAPDQVDTLRQDQVCPICGSDMEDGVCEVCNYEEPPEGFDNPDLEKAKEVDEQMHQQDAEQAAQGQQPGAPNDIQTNPNDPSSPKPMPGGAMPATSKVAETATVKVEKTSAQGGRIKTQERPILPVTRQLSDKPIGKKVITDSKAPVESKTRKDNMTAQTKIADGASANGEGVQADKRVDVEGVGAVTGDPLSGIDNENVEKDTGDFTAPHTDTWSGGEGDSLGQQDAVTSDAGELLSTVSATEKTADDSGVWDSPGHGFPDHDPTRVQLDGSLKEEVGGPTETDSSEEFRSLKGANPVGGDNSNEVGGPIGVAVANAKAQVYKALKVAETEVELGILDSDAKFDRASELEDTPVQALDAQIEAYAKVKTAGLRKATSTKAPTAGRVPSFRPVASFDIDAHAVEDEFEDSIF